MITITSPFETFESVKLPDPFTLYVPFTMDALASVLIPDTVTLSLTTLAEVFWSNFEAKEKALGVESATNGSDIVVVVKLATTLPIVTIVVFDVAKLEEGI